MLEEVLTRIKEAEAKAAEILAQAEKEIRKIETRNYANIQQMRDSINVKISKAVTDLEHEILKSAEDAAASIEKPAKQIIQKAKDLVVSFVIGGAS